MDPGNFASSTAEAAFEVDDRGRIVIWNRAAEQLLGYAAGQAIGKPCFELLCGRDIFGNRYCDQNCNPWKMLRGQEPVRNSPCREASASMNSAIRSLTLPPGLAHSSFTYWVFDPEQRRVAARLEQAHARSPVPGPEIPDAGSGTVRRPHANPADPNHTGKHFSFNELGERFGRLWKFHPPRIQWDFTYLRPSTQADPFCRGIICHGVIFRLFR